MALSPSTLDRERDKFSEGPSGETTVNVKPLSAGNLLEGISFDYIARTEPDGVTDIFTYRSGGESGSVVATITVVYANSSKSNISTIART